MNASTFLPFRLWVSLVVETHREGVSTFHQGWGRMGGLFFCYCVVSGVLVLKPMSTKRKELELGMRWRKLHHFILDMSPIHTLGLYKQV